MNASISQRLLFLSTLRMCITIFCTGHKILRTIVYYNYSRLFSNLLGTALVWEKNKKPEFIYLWCSWLENTKAALTATPNLMIEIYVHERRNFVSHEVLYPKFSTRYSVKVEVIDEVEKRRKWRIDVDSTEKKDVKTMMMCYVNEIPNSFPWSE